MSGRLRLYVLFGQIFVFQAGFGLVVPLIPIYTQKFAVGPLGVGIVVAVYGLARVLTDLPAGRLSGLIGHTRAMGVGALVLTVGSALTAFSSTYGELLIFRFISGAGAAITLVVGQSMAASNPGPYSRAKAISYYQAAFLAGLGIGPILAGPLAEAWGDSAPFLVYAALAAVVGVVGLLMRQPPAQEGVDAHGSIRRSLGLLRDLPFMLVSFIALMMFFTRTGGMQSLVPLLGTETFQLTTTMVGIAVGLNSIVNLVVTFAAGILMDRLDRRLLLLPGAAMLVASLGVYALTDTATAFYLAASLWGIGTGLAGPVTALYVTERAPHDVTGALALYRMISDIGYLLGPVLMGLSAAGWGIQPTFLWCAGLLAIAVLVFQVSRIVEHLRNRRLGRTEPDVLTLERTIMEADPSELPPGSNPTPHIRGSLHAIATGPVGAPRMVFIHPNPMDSSTWLYQLAHFSTWYRCIAVDLPGYGRSPKAVAGVTMEEVAEAIWEAVDADADGTGSCEPVILVGCSIGSHLAEHMYHLRPQGVAALVLSGTGWHGARREFAVARAEEYRREGVDYRYRHSFDDYSPAFRSSELALWYGGLIRERNAWADAESIAAMFDARVEQDSDRFYSELDAPVLIVSGSLDNSHAAAFLLDQRLPDSRIEVLEGAGHACYFERPDEFDAAVLAFLGGLSDRESPEPSAAVGASAFERN